MNINIFFNGKVVAAKTISLSPMMNFFEEVGGIMDKNHNDVNIIKGSRCQKFKGSRV